LLHLGGGSGRADTFDLRIGELLDWLAGQGYEFVRVDELLEPRPNELMKAGLPPAQIGLTQRPDNPP